MWGTMLTKLKEIIGYDMPAQPPSQADADEVQRRQQEVQNRLRALELEADVHGKRYLLERRRRHADE